MGYAVENAMTQWQDGERRMRELPELESAVEAVRDELRRRLGSTFYLHELAELYSRGTDWAEDLAQRRSAGTETSAVVDAAFRRYASGAADYAGGRTRFAGEG